jgi:hypothetical protein
MQIKQMRDTEAKMALATSGNPPSVAGGSSRPISLVELTKINEQRMQEEERTRILKPVVDILSPEDRARQERALLEREQQPLPPPSQPSQAKPPSQSVALPYLSVGGSDDLWSNPMFEDAKPPPGAPPFDLSMFASTTRVNYNLNPEIQ